MCFDTVACKGQMYFSMQTEFNALVIANYSKLLTTLLPKDRNTPMTSEVISDYSFWVTLAVLYAP